MKNIDVVIIGAGPAGLSAAIYLARASKDVLVLDKDAPGGKLLTIPLIANYPGQEDIKGPDLAMVFLNKAMKFGAKYEYGSISLIQKENGKFVITTDIEKIEAKVVIVATGLSNVPSIKGEKEFLHRGVSYCATCDGRFFVNKPMAVIGDSEQAEVEADYLSSLASDVYFFRNSEISLESPYYSSLLKKKNIHFIYNAKIKEIKGDNAVNSLEYVLDNEIKVLEVNAVFPLDGEKSASSFLSTLPLEMNKGFIKTNEDMETNVEGLYAIGDIREKKLRQVVTASSDGAIASSSVIRYLNNYGK